MSNIEKIKRILQLPFAQIAAHSAERVRQKKLKDQFFELRHAFEHGGFTRIQEFLNKPFEVVGKVLLVLRGDRFSHC